MFDVNEQHGRTDIRRYTDNKLAWIYFSIQNKIKGGVDSGTRIAAVLPGLQVALEGVCVCVCVCVPRCFVFLVAAADHAAWI